MTVASALQAALQRVAGNVKRDCGIEMYGGLGRSHAYECWRELGLAVHHSETCNADYAQRILAAQCAAIERGVEAAENVVAVAMGQYDYPDSGDIRAAFLRAVEET